MKTIFNRRWVEPILLLLFAILAYGLFIPKLGLFGDDWPHLWVFHMFGLEGLNKLVAWDRPFSAWVYALIAPLASEHIWGYHIYLLLLRWLSAIIFYYLIDFILPETHPLPLWSAAFFLLYPGFRQQPQPLEFILHFTALTLMLASFLLMVRAAKRAPGAWLLHIPGVIFSLSIFSVEYFIGLEILRPVLLWIVLSNSLNNWKQKLRYVLIHWSPYLAILSIYAYWRVFIFKFPTYKPTFLNQLGNNPLASITGLGQVLVEEIRAAILGAWRQVFSLPQQSGASWSYLTIVIVIFAISAGILYLRKNQAIKASPLIPLFLGALSILLAGIPFWITGIPVQLDFPWDRSTLPFMIGASLMLVGGILLLRPGMRNAAASLVIALCIGMQYQNTSLYQVEWNKLGEFFWQLTWRAPSLKPGTIVLSEDIPLFYYGDNNLTPVLNWTYAVDQASTEIKYNFFDMGERLGNNLPEMKPGLPVSHGYRFVNFQSNSSLLLPVFYKLGNCLRVVDEQLALDRSIPDRLKDAAVFSKPDSLILNIEEAKPPFFIPEPDHGWCYYYQKAGLAVQQKDWLAVNSLFDEVQNKELHPNDTTEWLPFIEGLVGVGKLDESIALTRTSLEQENARPVICGLWNRLIMSSNSKPEIVQSASQSGCD
jgi:hypothetical protein